jgi:ABC-2 type transport system permease protein
MSIILTIFRKELAGYFKSAGFYLCCMIVALIFTSIFIVSFIRFEGMQAQAMFNPGLNPQALNIHYGLFMSHFSILNLILLVVAPALTMRLFAEEKKMRTFDLLLTSPITSAQIVIGKYLAAFCAMFFICLIALIYPISTAAFAQLSWGPLLSAFFSIVILGAVYVAIDLFCSSLTDSMIVAMIMGLVFNLSLWFVGIGSDVIDSDWGRKVFEYISLNQHLMMTVEGTIKTSTLIFFVSIVVFFCFLCERVVEASRWRA